MGARNDKKDGHTHTEFCPHGSGDKCEVMIQKAIKMGFQEYSITEHAPLPPQLSSNYNGTQAGLATASITLEQVPHYLDFATKLQQQYRSQIKINVGFEVDYFADYERWTREFLDQYGNQTQDNILSVHFMPGIDGKYWCLDYNTDDFEQGFKNLIAQPQNLFQKFLRLELSAAQANLGQYKPQRLGHLTLIRKYQDYFGLSQEFNADNQEIINKILMSLKQQDGQLDLNTAGLYKEYCNQVYPDDWISERAQKMSVPLVFGSDAHSILEVGH
ncbi:histidinol-phosphatase HisJ [Paucilactobacillus hokkaidonensis]|uniref:histidinol-phosphatase HisJ n=1 Tax=Paucilactobacillus hokkaidonensis TaxID=1193095 RepID=UPI0006D1F844|nr:histidinol-phosphatase HisJ [Paucilactobacillus hokkaidonensis]